MEGEKAGKESRPAPVTRSRARGITRTTSLDSFFKHHHRSELSVSESEKEGRGEVGESSEDSDSVNLRSQRESISPGSAGVQLRTPSRPESCGIEVEYWAGDDESSDASEEEESSEEDVNSLPVRSEKVSPVEVPPDGVQLKEEEKEEKEEELSEELGDGEQVEEEEEKEEEKEEEELSEEELESPDFPYLRTGSNCIPPVGHQAQEEEEEELSEGEKEEEWREEEEEVWSEPELVDLVSDEDLQVQPPHLPQLDEELRGEEVEGEGEEVGESRLVQEILEILSDILSEGEEEVLSEPELVDLVSDEEVQVSPPHLPHVDEEPRGEEVEGESEEVGESRLVQEFYNDILSEGDEDVEEVWSDPELVDLVSDEELQVPPPHLPQLDEHLRGEQVEGEEVEGEEVEGEEVGGEEVGGEGESRCVQEFLSHILSEGEEEGEGEREEDFFQLPLITINGYVGVRLFNGEEAEDYLALEDGLHFVPLSDVIFEESDEELRRVPSVTSKDLSPLEEELGPRVLPTLEEESHSSGRRLRGLRGEGDSDAEGEEEERPFPLELEERRVLWGRESGGSECERVSSIQDAEEEERASSSTDTASESKEEGRGVFDFEEEEGEESERVSSSSESSESELSESEESERLLSSLDSNSEGEDDEEKRFNWKKFHPDLITGWEDEEIVIRNPDAPPGFEDWEPHLYEAWVKGEEKIQRREEKKKRLEEKRKRREEKEKRKTMSVSGSGSGSGRARKTKPVGVLYESELEHILGVGVGVGVSSPQHFMEEGKGGTSHNHSNPIDPGDVQEFTAQLGPQDLATLEKVLRSEQAREILETLALSPESETSTTHTHTHTHTLTQHRGGGTTSGSPLTLGEGLVRELRDHDYSLPPNWRGHRRLSPIPGTVHFSPPNPTSPSPLVKLEVVFPPPSQDQSPPQPQGGGGGGASLSGSPSPCVGDLNIRRSQRQQDRVERQEARRILAENKEMLKKEKQLLESPPTAPTLPEGDSTPTPTTTPTLTPTPTPTITPTPILTITPTPTPTLTPTPSSGGEKVRKRTPLSTPSPSQEKERGGGEKEEKRPYPKRENRKAPAHLTDPNFTRDEEEKNGVVGEEEDSSKTRTMTVTNAKEEPEKRKEKEEEDEDEKDDNDPNKLWCTCRQPHNNRFMICCDTCEEWFHGKCVGVTRAQGKVIEDSNSTWHCPACKRSHKAAQALQRKEEKSAASANAKREAGVKSTPGKKKAQQGQSPLPPPPPPTPSSRSKNSKEKSSKGKGGGDVLSRCISCPKPARPNSVYCSKECVLKNKKGKSLPSPSPSPSPSLKTTPKPSPKAEPRPSLTPGTPTLRTTSTITTTTTSSKKQSKPKKWTSEGSGGGRSEDIFTFHLIGQKSGSSTPTPTPHILSQKRASTSSDGGRRLSVETGTGKSVPLILGKTPPPPPLLSGKSGREEETGQGQGVMSMREMMKKGLMEALDKRIRESGSESEGPLIVPEGRSAEVAAGIEKQLMTLFESSTNIKSRTKYRSILFNIKDPKNSMYRELLSGRILAKALVRMEPHQMASPELAEWRTRETQKELEAIKRSEIDKLAEARKQALIDKGKEFDKVVVTSVDQEARNLLIPDPRSGTKDEKEKERERSESSKTRQRQKEEKGRVERRGEKRKGVGEEREVKMKRRGVSVESEPEQPSSTVKTPELRDESHSLLKVKAKDPPPPPHSSTGATLTPALTTKLMMPELGQFSASLFNVSHSRVDGTFFPESPVPIVGRISPDIVWDYIDKMKKNKELIVLRLAPQTPQDATTYMSFYSYLSSRKRFGVLGGISSPLKDVYLIPLGKTEAVNRTLLPFHGPGLPKDRTHCLLAIVTRHTGAEVKVKGGSGGVKRKRGASEDIEKRKVGRRERRGVSATQGKAPPADGDGDDDAPYTPWEEEEDEEDELGVGSGIGIDIDLGVGGGGGEKRRRREGEKTQSQSQLMLAELNAKIALEKKEIASMAVAISRAESIPGLDGEFILPPSPNPNPNPISILTPTLTTPLLSQSERSFFTGGGGGGGGLKVGVSDVDERVLFGFPPTTSPLFPPQPPTFKGSDDDKSWSCGRGGLRSERAKGKEGEKP